MKQGSILVYQAGVVSSAEFLDVCLITFNKIVEIIV